MTKSMYHGIIRIAAVALLLRGLLLLQVSNHLQTALTPDSSGYLFLAENLLTHGVFSRATAPPFEAEIERTPLYPLFLAAVFCISNDLKFAFFVQALLDVAICVLVICCGWLVWDERSALWAGFFAATSLGLIVSSVTLLTETLFTFFMILHGLAGIVFLKELKQAPNWRKLLPKLAIAALALACAALTRPVALYLVIPEAWLIWRQIKRKWQHKIAVMALYVLVYLMSLSPWIMRNWMIFGEPMVSMIGSYALYTHNAAALESYTTGCSYEAAQAALERRAQERFVEAGIAAPASLRHEARLRSERRVSERFRRAGIPDSLIGAQARIYRDMAAQMILHRPLAYLRLHLASTAKNFLPSTVELYQRLGIVQKIPSTLEVLKARGIGAAALNYFGGKWPLLLLAFPAVLLLCSTYIAFLFGCYNLIKHRRGWPFSFIILIIVYLALMPGVMSEPRYGVPIMPFISLVAGYGMCCFFNRKNKDNHRAPGQGGLP